MINLKNGLYGLSLLLGLAGLNSCQTESAAFETASIVVDSTTIARHLEELASDMAVGPTNTKKPPGRAPTAVSSSTKRARPPIPGL